MKVCLIVILFLCNQVVFCQDTLITYDGREVVLLENHTWQFVYRAQEELKTLNKDTNDYHKDFEASFLLTNEVSEDFCFYYNPELWLIDYIPQSKKMKEMGAQEHRITSKNHLVSIYINYFEGFHSLVPWKNYLVETTNDLIKSGKKILEQNIRTSNQLEGLFFKTKLVANKQKFVTYNYLLTSNTGSVNINCTINLDLEDKYDELIKETFSGIIKCDKNEE